MQSPAKLYLRVRLPDGSHPFLKAAFASNGRVRPGYAIHQGKAISFPGSTYYLRYQSNGKRVWEPAGHDASLAVVKLQRKVHAFEGVVLGIAEPPAAVIPDPIISTPVVSHQPPVPSQTDKRLLSDCVAKYIAETKEHKSDKTLAAYRLTVLALCSVTTGTSIGKLTDEDFLKRVASVGTCIEDLTREDLLSYITALRKKGCSPRTIRNRIDQVQIFLHRFKLKSLLTGSDLPKFTVKKVRAYNPLELGKMFGRATQDAAYRQPDRQGGLAQPLGGRKGHHLRIAQLHGQTPLRSAAAALRNMTIC